MPATVALLFTLIGVMLVGVVVCFTGALRIVLARRRARAVRAPLFAAGIGFVVALGAAITLTADAALHLTSVSMR